MQKFSYRSAALKGRKVKDPEIASLSNSILDGGFKLIIIRGIPGSGKSHTANRLKQALNDAVVCEADMFMGQKFDVSRLNECHSKCQELVRFTLKEGKIAIISNTNTTLGEMEIYRKIALEEGLTENQITIIEPLTYWKYDVDECVKKCTHKGIPRKIMEKHMNNIVFLPKDTSELIRAMREVQL